MFTRMSMAGSGAQSLDAPARRWLFLPIETKARELDGKALLAFAAAERGWAAVIGHRPDVVGSALPRGVYIGKSIEVAEAANLQALVQRDSRVCAWCEEGLVYPNAQEYGRRKVDLAAYDLLDRYFAWGQNQLADMRSLGCDAGKARATGNPRFDLHRPELRSVIERRAASIKARVGPFILVNTRFSRFNNYVGAEAMIESMRKDGRLRSKEQEEEARGLAKFQEKMFYEFLSLVETLSQHFADRTIVVRPHPSENHDPWLALAERLPNVQVIYDGNVVDWIQAADVSVHNNCTTGVESYLLDKTSIAYQPFSDDRYDLYLPNVLSADARSASAVVALIEDKVARASSVSRDPGTAVIAQNYIANSGTGLAACTAVVDALDAIDVPEAALSLRPTRARSLVSAARDRVKPIIKAVVAPKKTARWRRYLGQKFRGLELSELSGILGDVQRDTAQYQDLAIGQLGKDVFCVYRP